MGGVGQVWVDFELADLGGFFGVAGWLDFWDSGFG